MKRLIPFRSDRRLKPWKLFSALLLTCATGTAAWAQHAGGHLGGPGHFIAPPASHAGVPRPVTPIRLPSASPGTQSLLMRPSGFQNTRPPVHFIGFTRRPILTHRPVFPIFPIRILPPRRIGLFNIPFFGYGFGLGFESGLWMGCDPFFNWRYGCAGFPVYQYAAGDNSFSLGLYNPQPQTEIQNWPVYLYGADNPQFVDLYLKDGTVYNVTDYWLANGELHFKAVEEHGARVVEHQIDFGLLDLQKSIDVNTARGFRFVLRNEPLEQYLRDYPPSDSPNGMGTEPGPARP